MLIRIEVSLDDVKDFITSKMGSMEFTTIRQGIGSCDADTKKYVKSNMLPNIIYWCEGETK